MSFHLNAISRFHIYRLIFRIRRWSDHQSPFWFIEPDSMFSIFCRLQYLLVLLKFLYIINSNHSTSNWCNNFSRIGNQLQIFFNNEKDFKNIWLSLPLLLTKHFVQNNFGRWLKGIPTPLLFICRRQLQPPYLCTLSLWLVKLWKGWNMYKG